ncbi:MAG: mycothiol conjugate amidase Mca [Actinobacteria bacterium]|nr:mycothiol conjugate amidase Mca [Actinomycetota bacterium]
MTENLQRWRHFAAITREREIDVAAFHPRTRHTEVVTRCQRHGRVSGCDGHRFGLLRQSGGECAAVTRAGAECRYGEHAGCGNAKPSAATKRLLAELRPGELAESARIIGFSRVEMLGYRDSGMPESPANSNPLSFHMADVDEATGRLVASIRANRPQVMITYGDDQRGYPHPDHLKVHDISVLAFDRAGDDEWYPDAGAAWQPLKLYYSVWSRARLTAVHEALLRLRGSSPYDEKWFERPNLDARITTRLHVGDFLWARSGALRAHKTQVDEREPFWFGLSDAELAEVYPYEDWVLARSLVPTRVAVSGAQGEGAVGDGVQPAAELEDDLFAGIRTPARS